MKTDQEIKEFIDGREVLIRRDLVKFMYRKYNGGCLHSKRLIKFWNYVLKTKSWEDLRKYQDKRNRSGGNKKGDKYKRIKFDKYCEIYKKDKRLEEFGLNRATKLLENIYGLKLSPIAVYHYKKEIKCTQKSN